MKRLLLGVATLSFLLGAPAFAADMAVRHAAPVYKAPPIAPVAAYDWSGFYIGVSGGSLWGSSTHDFPGSTHGSFDVSGGLIGGTAGFNMQMGAMLLGVEGDLSWVSSNGSTLGAPTACVGGNCTTDLTWLGTARGRIGYVAGMWMPYLTGGLAFGNVNACEAAVCGSSGRTGWTAGGGFEAMFSQNWSAKAEYLYTDLGSATTYTFAALPHSVSLTQNMIRVGIDYHFGGMSGGALSSRY